MMFKGVIFAVASVLASSAYAEGGHAGVCADAGGTVDWVDPTIGATSHMLVPAYPTVSVPFGMYRFTPPAPWFTVDEFDEVSPERRSAMPTSWRARHSSSPCLDILCA